MFIYHFNQMIKSKILWGIFAIVIAVAFLSVDSCGRGGGSDSYDDSVGSVGAEKITQNEYDFARIFVDRGAGDLPPAVTETQVWAHIAAMRTASEMGIGASPKEVQSLILQNPAFQQNGAFNKALYQSVLKQSMSLAPTTYERLLSHQIILAKLMSAVSSGISVSDMELEDETAARTDTFTIKYATVTNGFVNAEVTVDDKELTDYYAANQSEFALPDRVRVRFVTIPVSNYVASVVVPEDDLLDFYDSDPSRYTRQGTNGVVQLTFDEARASVSNDLVAIEATHIATTNIAAIVESLKVDGLDDFTKKLESLGYKTKESPFFSFDSGYVPGVEPQAMQEFRENASELDLSSTDGRMAIARGKRNVYMMHVVTNDFAHTPAFEVVKDRIVATIKKNKRDKLFDDYAFGVRTSLKDATAKSNFEESAKGLGLEVSEEFTFSPMTLESEPFQNAMAIIPEVMRTPKGDFTKPVSVYNGGVIAYVSERKPAEAFEVLSWRSNLQGELENIEKNLFFAEWLLDNLKERTFTSKRLQYLLEDALEDDDEIE